MIPEVLIVKFIMRVCIAKGLTELYTVIIPYMVVKIKQNYR